MDMAPIKLVFENEATDWLDPVGNSLAPLTQMISTGYDSDRMNGKLIILGTKHSKPCSLQACLSLGNYNSNPCSLKKKLWKCDKRESKVIYGIIAEYSI